MPSRKISDLNKVFINSKWTAEKKVPKTYAGTALVYSENAFSSIEEAFTSVSAEKSAFILLDSKNKLDPNLFPTGLCYVASDVITAKFSEDVQTASVSITPKRSLEINYFAVEEDSPKEELPVLFDNFLNVNLFQVTAEISAGKWKENDSHTLKESVKKGVLTETENWSGTLNASAEGSLDALWHCNLAVQRSLPDNLLTQERLCEQLSPLIGKFQNIAFKNISISYETVVKDSILGGSNTCKVTGSRKNVDGEETSWKNKTTLECKSSGSLSVINADITDASGYSSVFVSATIKNTMHIMDQAEIKRYLPLQPDWIWDEERYDADFQCITGGNSSQVTEENRSRSGTDLCNTSTRSMEKHTEKASGTATVIWLGEQKNKQRELVNFKTVEIHYSDLHSVTANQQNRSSDVSSSTNVSFSKNKSVRTVKKVSSEKNSQTSESTGSVLIFKSDIGQIAGYSKVEIQEGSNVKNVSGGKYTVTATQSTTETSVFTAADILSQKKIQIQSSDNTTATGIGKLTVCNSTVNNISGFKDVILKSGALLSSIENNNLDDEQEIGTEEYRNSQNKNTVSQTETQDLVSNQKKLEIKKNTTAYTLPVGSLTLQDATAQQRLVGYKDFSMSGNSFVNADVLGAGIKVSSSESSVFTDDNPRPYSMLKKSETSVQLANKATITSDGNAGNAGINGKLSGYNTVKITAANVCTVQRGAQSKVKTEDKVSVHSKTGIFTEIHNISETFTRGGSFTASVIISSKRKEYKSVQINGSIDGYNTATLTGTAEYMVTVNGEIRNQWQSSSTSKITYTYADYADYSEQKTSSENSYSEEKYSASGKVTLTYTEIHGSIAGYSTLKISHSRIIRTGENCSISGGSLKITRKNNAETLVFSLAGSASISDSFVQTDICGLKTVTLKNTSFDGFIRASDTYAVTGNTGTITLENAVCSPQSAVLGYGKVNVKGGRSVLSGYTGTSGNDKISVASGAVLDWSGIMNFGDGKDELAISGDLILRKGSDFSGLEKISGKGSIAMEDEVYQRLADLELLPPQITVCNIGSAEDAKGCRGRQFELKDNSRGKANNLISWLNTGKITDNGEIKTAETDGWLCNMTDDKRLTDELDWYTFHSDDLISLSLSDDLDVKFYKHGSNQELEVDWIAGEGIKTVCFSSCPALEHKNLDMKVTLSESYSNTIKTYTISAVSRLK